MPISAVAAGVGIAATAANSINNAVSGGSPSSGGGGGGGQQMTPQQFAYYNNSYFYQGISEGQTRPGIGASQEQSVAGLPNDGRVTASKPVDDTGKASVANPRATPTQGASQEESDAQGDFKNMWADRLSHYLDYNTRSLG